MKNKLLIPSIIIALSNIAAISQVASEQYFKNLTLKDLQEKPISEQRIDGTPNALPEGSILVYETNEHRKGKLLVRKIGYDLEIDWVTYKDNGRIYSFGNNTVIKGTFQFDFDNNIDLPESYDLWWEQVNKQQRFIVPQNKAKFGKIEIELVSKDNDLIYPYPINKVNLSKDIEIAYADEGHGDYTLLFIHGLGGYHQVWKKNIDILRKTNHCIALDLPGYGLSSKGDYPFSVKFYSDVISEFITTLKLKNVVLIGHSLGGQIAVLTALKKLPEIKKLVLLAPSGLQIFNDSQKAGIEWLAKPERTKNRTEKQLTLAFKASYASRNIPTDAQFMLKYRLNLKNRPDYFDYFCNMTYKLSIAVADEPILNQLENIKIPTLLLWGKEDSQISSNFAYEITKRIRDCDLQMISPCGHMVQWECARDVNDKITNFALKNQNNEQDTPVALFTVESTVCIAPCVIQFINKSINAERYAWMVDDKIVSYEKDFTLNIKEISGFRIKLIAYKGNKSDEYEKSVRGLGE